MKGKDGTAAWLAALVGFIAGSATGSGRSSGTPPPDPPPTSENSGWRSWLKLGIEVVTVVLLFFTAKIQYDSFIVQQGRPFLTLEINEIRTPASGEKVNGEDAVEWVYSVRNHGHTPAYQERSYALTSVAGRAVYGLNTAPPKATDTIESISPEERPIGGIVAPEGTSTKTFLMPKSVFNLLLKSDNKLEDGISFRVDYAGPWDRRGKRTYYYQLRVIPWLDGKFIRFKINAQNGN